MRGGPGALVVTDFDRGIFPRFHVPHSRARIDLVHVDPRPRGRRAPARARTSEMSSDPAS